MKHLKVSVWLFIMLSFIQDVCAQNMNNPYSIYGVGDIDHRAYNRTDGMAATGLALVSSKFLIDNNPAGLAGLDKSFFSLDLAAAGKTSTFKGDAINTGNSTGSDFGLKRLSMSVKLNRFWASGIGFSQFSNVNYQFAGTREIEGSAKMLQAYFRGDGGLNEYYWTNSFSLGKHLSAGIRASMLAGSINQQEMLTDATLASPISTEVQDYIAKGRIKAGAVYAGNVGKRWKLSIGAVFVPRSSMISERTLTVLEGDVAIIEDEFLKSNHFATPTTFGTGIALKHNDKTTFAVDYNHEAWSDLNLRGNGWQLRNSDRVSGGVEFSKHASIWNQSVEKKYFQAGAYYGKSYLQIRNETINEFGFTAGMGGYLNPLLRYTVSIEAGSRGTTQAKLIKENFFQFTFTFSYRDFINSKGRKYN